MNRKLIAVILFVAVLMTMTACNPEKKVEAAVESTASVSEEGNVNKEPNPTAVVNPFETTGTNETEEENAPADNSEETEQNQPTESEINTEETVESTVGSDVIIEDPNPASGDTDYERYIAMTGDEQKEFIDSFESVEAFFEWLNNAKAEYEAAHPDIEINGDNVNIGDLIVEGN